MSSGVASIKYPRAQRRLTSPTWGVHHACPKVCDNRAGLQVPELMAAREMTIQKKRAYITFFTSKSTRLGWVVKSPRWGEISQSQILPERFWQKGYQRAVLEGEIENVRSLYINTLVSGPKIIRENKHEYEMVLDYNIQHNKLERIITKHWGILLTYSLFIHSLNADTVGPHI